MNIPKRLCCLIKQYAFCYYCGEHWCSVCWFSNDPSAGPNWDGSQCPIPNWLIREGLKARGNHADYTTQEPVAQEYKDRFEKALLPSPHKNTNGLYV